jgi:3-oxoacyl-[acyl-carrier protein] reductase
MGPRDRDESARRLSHLPDGGSAHVAEGMPGKLITISSGAHNSDRKGAAHYCASKAGVMFTKLAMELGPHRINVNCIAPGLIQLERSVDEVSEEVIRTIVVSAV